MTGEFDWDESVENESNPTEQIRIIGAQEAGKLVANQELPSNEFAKSENENYEVMGSTPEDISESQGGPDSVSQALPHWTEPPTGEVPKVFAQGMGESTSLEYSQGPIWKGDDARREDEFDHRALLGDENSELHVETPLDDNELFSFDEIGATDNYPYSSEKPEEYPSRDRVSEHFEASSSSFPDAAKEEREDSNDEDLAVTSSEVGTKNDTTPVATNSEPDDREEELHRILDGNKTVRIGSGIVSGFDRLAQGARTGGKRSAETGRNLGVAVTTGLLIGAIIVILFLFGSGAALVVVLVAITLAVAEYFAVMRKAGYRPATLLGLVGTITLMLAAYNKGEPGVIVVLAIVTVFTLLWYLWGVTDSRPASGVAVTLLGFMWISFLGSFAALLLDPQVHPDRHGVALLFGAIVATVGYDVGGYLIGGRFGRHKMSPQVSPNKTWEGLAGGVVSSIVVSVVFLAHLHPWSENRALLLGLVVAVAAPFGDLCQSMIKRDIGIKDMSAAIPGHGGVLDRIDAMLFVMPAVYFLARVLNIS